jgi:hypothetical protein
VSLAWDPVPGAAKYRVYTQYGLYTESVATSGTWGGLGQMTRYEWTVAAVNSGGVEGPRSNVVAGSTGRPEQRKQGQARGEWHPDATNSWRPDVGWGYIGTDVAQGYYSVATRRYRGVISMNRQRMLDWLTASFGADVAAYCSVIETRIDLTRDNAAGGGAPNLGWYVTTRWAGTGGEPDLAGGHATAGHARGTRASHYLPGHWGGHILRADNGWTGFCLASDSTAAYSQYLGGANVTLSFVFSWDFVTVPYVAPSWG